MLYSSNTPTIKRIIPIFRKLLAPFPIMEGGARLMHYYIKEMIHISPPKEEYTECDVEQNDGPATGQQILVDVSQLIRHDRHAGIERVVRSVLTELMRTPPSGAIVKPVYANDTGVICYANQFAQSFCCGRKFEKKDSPISVAAGDIFYSADFYLNLPLDALQQLRRREVRCIFTIHDIIPLRFPRFFWRADMLAFSKWFRGVLSVADGIVTVSQAVADDIYDWLQENHKYRKRPLSLGYFHLGSAILQSDSPKDLDSYTTEAVKAARQRLTFLMVGILEPRKGHAQTLDAIELLWKIGVDVNLVIVGKNGWRTRALATRLNKHIERNHRLFWVDSANDELLSILYAKSSALIAASYAEGFGLPIVEAAQHGLPIIARDIPIFREIAGEYAFYFDGTDPVSISEALNRWIYLHNKNENPSSIAILPLTWEQSVDQLKQCIIQNQWYKMWHPLNPPVAK